MAFVDIEKVLDKAPTEKLWWLLWVFTKINCVREHQEGYTSRRHFKPILFRIPMDEMIQKSNDEVKKLLVSYKNLQPTENNENGFAHQVVMLV